MTKKKKRLGLYSKGRREGGREEDRHASRQIDTGKRKTISQALRDLGAAAVCFDCVNVGKLFHLWGLSFLTRENGGVGTMPSSAPCTALVRIRERLCVNVLLT